MFEKVWAVFSDKHKAKLSEGFSFDPDKVFRCCKCNVKLDIRPSEMMRHMPGETYECSACFDLNGGCDDHQGNR